MISTHITNVVLEKTKSHTHHILILKSNNSKTLLPLVIQLNNSHILLHIRC